MDEDGPLPVSEAVDITLQIAQALVHAAGRGVVHRDIKPSNIILTPLGRAKLVDMGLARRFEREADHGLTQSGMTLGTFDYISPEQARDPRDVDVRSDLYSLGCTIFHMLTGRPPFPGGTVLQKLLQHQEEAPPEIRGLNADVPVELARIITKLMAKDRDRRYQSPEQLVRDLLVIAGQLGLSIVAADQHDWHAGPSSDHLGAAPDLVLPRAGVLRRGGRAGLVGPGAHEPGALGARLQHDPGSLDPSPSRTGRPAPNTAAASIATEADDPAPPISAPPRNFLVRSSDDLLEPDRHGAPQVDHHPHRRRPLSARGPDGRLPRSPCPWSTAT